MSELRDNMERFVSIYRENIIRPGSDKLLNFLLGEQSDFFTAPASSWHHSCFEGGLCAHSLNVYDRLKDYLERPAALDEYGLSYTDESIAIVSLLHDICKVNLYRISFRNVKNEYGEWEKKPFYEYHDTLPYGHGEKSVYMITSYMKLTREEAMAIRWHMGFSSEQNSRTISKALRMYPLALALYIADMEATFYLEEDNDD